MKSRKRGFLKYKGIDDIGWGCAYRCAQMVFIGFECLLSANQVVSNFCHKKDPRVTSKPFPFIADIMVTLGKVFLIQNFVFTLVPKNPEITGYEAWIEPPQIGKFMKDFYGICGEVKSFRFTQDTYHSILKSCVEHFQHHGTPICVDDRIYA